MEINIVKNKENWPKQGSFSQDWEWGEVLRAEGLEVERLVVKEGKIVAKAQVVYKILPFGWKYAFCPKGPIVVILSETKDLPRQEQILHSVQNDSYKALVDYLRKKRCVFFRCEPDEMPTGVKLLPTRDISPRATVVLDLAKSEEEILAGMKKNTRYSIRFAEKQNLIIKKENNLEVFWKLLRATAARDEFATHPKEHYQHILAHPQVWQLTAYKDEVPVASAVFIGSGDTVTYIFAASDYDKHQLLAPYLIQWEAVKLVKKLGYKFYDFYGIAPGRNKKLETPAANRQLGNWKLGGDYEYDRDHQYAGITKFKLGFGGAIRSFPGTFDLVLDAKKYLIYNILHFIYGIRKIGR